MTPDPARIEDMRTAVAMAIAAKADDHEGIDELLSMTPEERRMPVIIALAALPSLVLTHLNDDMVNKVGEPLVDIDALLRFYADAWGQAS